MNRNRNFGGVCGEGESVDCAGARGEKESGVRHSRPFLACRLFDILNVGTWRRRLMRLAINLPDTELASANSVHLREVGFSNRHHSLKQILEWNTRMESLYMNQSTIPWTRAAGSRAMTTFAGILRIVVGGCHGRKLIQD